MRFLSSWLEKKDSKKPFYHNMRTILLGGGAVVLVSLMGFSYYSVSDESEYCNCDRIEYI